MLLEAMTKHEGGRYHDGERFLPWYTSPCLEWLMKLDLVGKKVFEYGTGDSTKWYSSQGADVYGVDSEAKWLPECADLDALGFRITDDEKLYISYNPIMGDAAFDIVAIDGLYRDKCTKYALHRLRPGGYLIIDNYKQPSVQMDWPETDKLIEGMEQTLYKEPGHYDGWQTLVVRKPL